MDLPTQRRPVGRIDWFFTRGLTASAPSGGAAGWQPELGS